MNRNVYFAGELFSLKHLAGNASLAEAIEEQSGGRFRCALPQNFEQREVTPEQIRNSDFAGLLESDLGLFHFDGTELDSGTVAEFLFAKFLDIPSVVIRSDFRAAGDQAAHPWNLMLSNYPRTEVVLVDSLSLYQKMLSKSSGQSFAAAVRATEAVAAMVIEALDRVQDQPPVMPPEHERIILDWARTAIGGNFSKFFSDDRVASLIDKKHSGNGMSVGR